MENYSLYSKKQLNTERSRGLILSDEQNKNFYKKCGSENIVNWTIKEFEDYLSTKYWDDSTKHYHRVLFTGSIKFCDGGFEHIVNDDIQSPDGYSFTMSHYDVKIKRYKYLHGQIFCRNFPAYTRVNPSVFDEFMKKDDIIYVFKWGYERFINLQKK